MIYAVCGGPILELFQGKEPSFMPAWWVKSGQWGAAALVCRELRPVDLERVALALADEAGGLRTALLWVGAGPIAAHLRGLRGFALQAEALGAWFDLVLDETGTVKPDAPADVTVAYVGWEAVTLVQVQDGIVAQLTTLAPELSAGFQSTAGRVLTRAFQDHTIRWDLLEAGWRVQQMDLPFALQQADLGVTFAAAREAGAEVFSGLGEKAYREIYDGNGHPWASAARGLARYAQFLEQQAGRK